MDTPQQTHDSARKAAAIQALNSPSTNWEFKVEIMRMLVAEEDQKTQIRKEARNRLNADLATLAHGMAAK